MRKSICNIKRLTVVAVFILATGLAFGQRPNQHPNYDKVKALRAAHITNTMDLTEAEAAKFWPIYNKYEKQKLQYWAEMNTLRNKPISNLSEKDAKKIVEQMVTVQEKLALGKVSLMRDLLKVLPAKKVVLLKKAEGEFRRKMIKDARNRRKG